LNRAFRTKSDFVDALDLSRTRRDTRGDIMAENTKREKVQNYIESDDERERGHADTRKATQECEKPDPHLGCDPGIDVPG
jgi:hypothetical protein